VKQRTSGHDELACANRHGLDHDRARGGLLTRSDVTMGLWKFFASVLQFGIESEPFVEGFLIGVVVFSVAQARQEDQ
jgi:hypothetical protein